MIIIILSVLIHEDKMSHKIQFYKKIKKKINKKNNKITIHIVFLMNYHQEDQRMLH